MPKARANGIELEYDIAGPEGARPLMLIMGLGSQMTRWAPPLIDKLVAADFRVLRFDNRDVGLSQKMDAAGLPDLKAIFEALAAGRAPPLAYTLDDMAADAAGLLDAVGFGRAHIAGASMGGMIAQLLAADHSHKVLSLTSIMSTTGNRALPTATPEAQALLATRGPSPTEDRAGFLARAVESARTIGSPGYPADKDTVERRALEDAERCYYPVGFARQYAAAAASADRRPKLRTITAPTVVLHGEDDPLVPAAGGRDTAENIPGAELRLVPGMGHDLPPALYDMVVDAIASAARRAG